MKKHSPFVLNAYIAGIGAGLVMAMVAAAITVGLPFITGPDAYILNVTLGVVFGYPFGVIAGVGVVAQIVKQKGSWWMLVTATFVLSLALIVAMSRLSGFVAWQWLWSLYLLVLPFWAAVAYRGRWQKMIISV